MLDESRFESLADAFLSQLAEMLEPADEQGKLELEEQDGIITLSLPGGRQYVISRHGPSRQIWLSSPTSGGLHFSYNEAASAWMLKDGRELFALLLAELAQHGITL